MPKGVGGSMQKINTIAKYKFMLAFENQNAQDYVTEKFFHTLYSGSVPGDSNFFFYLVFWLA